jgi:putative ABC transport system permease protein
MFYNYLKISLRNLLRHKGYSLIIIAGLAVGMACSMLILMWVQDELSFDKFNKNADDICRVVENQYYANGEVFPVAVTPSALAKALRDEFPEVARTTRLSFRTMTIRHGNNLFSEGIAFADPDIFEILTVPFLKGNLQTALSGPHSIVLAEEAAQRYFGDEDPLGKVVVVDNQDDFVVTGVIKNLPHNSHLRFDVLAPFVYLKERGSSMDDWDSNWCYTYVLLRPNTPYEAVNRKIVDVIKRHGQSSTEIHLQALTDIHLYSASKYAVDFADEGNIQYVRMFFAVALFVLLIACVNFMNLVTARSERRAKEVGLRKVVGAGRSQLVVQFFGEAMVISLIAFLLALGCVELMTPLFNDLSGKSLDLGQVGPPVILAFLAVALLAGLISGSYPALLLSSFRPVESLKAGRSAQAGGSLFRRVLVVGQFTLSIVMIIGTLVISRQIDYIHHKNLGFNKENLAYVWMSGNFRQKHDVAEKELLRNPNITSITVTSELPTYVGSSRAGWDWDGKAADVRVLMHDLNVDYDYAKTFQMTMSGGRFFSREFSTDSNAVVVNEAAVSAMDMQSPIGKRLSLGGRAFTIIGVVKNFNFKPLQSKIEPLVLWMQPSRYYAMVMRIKTEDIQGTIAYVEKVYKEFDPDRPFHFNFLDQDYDNLYRAEERVGRISASFALIAIFIAALGLLGLASYMAERRTKEIGVRKVLGASVPGVVGLLTREYVWLVCLANLFAWPLAYYVLNLWLQDYAYRISVGIGTFLLAGGIAFLIALLTVSYQAIRAATTNPVEALRYE